MKNDEFCREISRALGPHLDAIDAAISREKNILTQPAWLHFQLWLDSVAVTSGMYEVRALSSPIGERMVFSLLHLVGYLPAVVIRKNTIPILYIHASD